MSIMSKATLLRVSASPREPPVPSHTHPPKARRAFSHKKAAQTIPNHAAPSVPGHPSTRQRCGVRNEVPLDRTSRHPPPKNPRADKNSPPLGPLRAFAASREIPIPIRTHPPKAMFQNLPCLPPLPGPLPHFEWRRGGRKGCAVGVTVAPFPIRLVAQKSCPSRKSCPKPAFSPCPPSRLRARLRSQVLRTHRRPSRLGTTHHSNLSPAPSGAANRFASDRWCYPPATIQPPSGGARKSPHCPLPSALRTHRRPNRSPGSIKNHVHHVHHVQNLPFPLVPLRGFAASREIPVLNPTHPPKARRAFAHKKAANTIPNPHTPSVRGHPRARQRCGVRNEVPLDRTSRHQPPRNPERIMALVLPFGAPTAPTIRTHRRPNTTPQSAKIMSIM